MPTLNRRRMLIAAALMGGAAPALTAYAADDTAAITHTLKAQFDRPEAPLQVRPVVVQGAHAVAGWQQAERGGRALLQRDAHAHSGWAITLCAGDGLRQAAVLQQAGVPVREAQALQAAVAQAEQRLPAAERQRLSTFEGVMRVQGSHPAASHPH
jgi:hypothetical protein